MWIILTLINISLISAINQIYRRVPRTTGLDINYFKNDLDSFDNIPTY